MTVSLARLARATVFCTLLTGFSTVQADALPGAWSGGLSPDDVEVMPEGSTSPQTLRFGAALAIDGATVLAGMPEYGAGVGRVAVFSHTGPGAWPRTASLSASDGQSGDLFGSGVAVSGDTAFVTSMRALYVYRRNGSAWTESQRIAVNSNEWLTGVVRAHAGWAAIGIDNPDGTASVMVLQADARGRWVARARLRAFDQEAFDGFGSSLALWRDTLVIGAPEQSERNGAAYVFRRYGTRWIQQQKLLPFDGALAGSFGHSVAVHGNVVVVGAPSANHEGGFVAGYDYLLGGTAYVFSRQGRDFGSLQQLRPTREENSWYQDFGDSVAIANGRVAVSAAWPITRFDRSHVFLYALHRRAYALQSMFSGEASTGDDIALSASALIAGVPWDPMFSIGYAQLHEFGVE